MRDLRFPNMKDSKIFIFCLSCFLIVAMILNITVDYCLKQGFNCDLLKEFHTQSELGGGNFKGFQVFVFWSCSFMHRWEMCNAVFELVRVSCHAYMRISRCPDFLCWIWPFSIFFFLWPWMCLHELVFLHHLCVCFSVRVCMCVLAHKQMALQPSHSKTSLATVF